MHSGNIYHSNTLHNFMETYNKLFENNKKWVEGQLASDPHFFEDLSRTQTPDFLYIGCSDSRVPANEIVGLEPGELFVHRNIANLVAANDLNSLSVIEYAVVHLQVKHIIVCGHYNCGGVKAAMQPKDLGILNPWLRNIRDVYRTHKEELQTISNEEERYNRLVELNVQEQCINVIKLACVQEAYLKAHYPVVHGWVFDLKTGMINDLKLDFDNILHGIQEIYNLTDSVWKENSFEIKKENP